MEGRIETKVACGCEITHEDWNWINCQCEEVSRGEVNQAINEGTGKVEEIKQRTRKLLTLAYKNLSFKLFWDRELLLPRRKLIILYGKE